MIRSYFEGYRNNKAIGWIYNHDEPRTRYNVALIVNEKSGKTVEASEFRQDLLDAGLGDGCYSFCIDLPDSIEGRWWLKIVETGEVIEGSAKADISDDRLLNLLTRSKNFSHYNQFKLSQKHLEQATECAYTIEAKRVRSKFSASVGTYEGIPISAHAQWAIEKNRRGNASFLSSIRENLWEDLLWYYFDYTEKEKRHVILEESSFLVKDNLYKQFKGISILLLSWILRRRKAITSIPGLSEADRCEFLATLGAANLNASHDRSLSELNKLVRTGVTNGLTNEVPKLSKYLKWKYQTGYQNAYCLDSPADYLAFLFDSILHATAIELPFFGEEVLTYFAKTVSVNGVEVSRFEFLCWYYYTAGQGKNRIIIDSIERGEMISFFDDFWLRSHPEHVVFRSGRKAGEGKNKVKHRCYVVANWHSASGLTQNALMTLRALEMMGITCVQLLPTGDYHSDLNWPSGRVDGALALNCDVVIFHINSDEVPKAVEALSEKVDIDEAKLIGFYLWELERLAKVHQLGVDLVDQVWVPTKFVYDAFATYAPDKIRQVGKGLIIPNNFNKVRYKYKLPETSYVFLLSFDHHSCIERKNPLPAVRAFQKAFTNGENVLLFVKTTEHQDGHWGDPFDQWNKISSLAENDDRIIISEEYLDNQGFFDLINACNAVVSTHRSEGFGYLPAYAVALGKDVIVTNYSGTSDFCNEHTANLVDYRLEPVPFGKFIYPIENGAWADVDVDSLVRAYSACYLGVSAKKSSKAKNMAWIRKKYSFVELCKNYRKNLEELGVVSSSVRNLAVRLTAERC